MTRYIDANALEKAINEWMPKDQETWMESDIPPIENLVVSIMMTIEEQPTIDAEPHWIPCSERLPEYDEEVLCQDVGGNMMVLFRSERTNEWTDGLYYSEPLNMIVAWRELPKHYREF